MKITQKPLFVGAMFFVVVSFVSLFASSYYFVKLKKLVVSAVTVDSLWQDYNNLKFEVFCQTNDGAILVKHPDFKKLNQFKSAALAAKEAELIIPMSNAARIEDIDNHLEIFDREASGWVSSHSDHHLPTTANNCFPLKQEVPAKTKIVTASSDKKKNDSTARG